MFKRLKRAKKAKKDNKPLSYDEGVRAGSVIGNIVTNLWNSQKNPGKVYVGNRRVHHGEIGVLLGLSALLKKRRPDATGIISGLGQALSEDDIADKEEWFRFRKKEKTLSSERSTKEGDQDIDRNKSLEEDNAE